MPARAGNGLGSVRRAAPHIRPSAEVLARCPTSRVELAELCRHERLRPLRPLRVFIYQRRQELHPCGILKTTNLFSRPLLLRWRSPDTRPTSVTAGIPPPPKTQTHTSVKPPLFRKRAARCMRGACVAEAGTGRLFGEATMAALLGRLLAAEEAPPPGQEPLTGGEAARCCHVYLVRRGRRIGW